ncbi:MAG: hypothetical protein NW900_02695 [Candidatus Blochmannia sp. A2]|nr:hypothetical protein [Candidatus Blochmannia sp. A2]
MWIILYIYIRTYACMYVCMYVCMALDWVGETCLDDFIFLYVIRT